MDALCGQATAACWTRFGKHFQRPLADVTRLLAADLARSSRLLRYSGAITSAQGMKARWAAWKMRLFGFRQLKVKVGLEGQDDVKRLESIRRFAVLVAGTISRASTP